MDTQILLFYQAVAQCVGNVAHTNLQGRTVFHQRQHVSSDFLLDFTWLTRVECRYRVGKLNQMVNFTDMDAVGLAANRWLQLVHDHVDLRNMLQRFLVAQTTTWTQREVTIFVWLTHFDNHLVRTELI